MADTDPFADYLDAIEREAKYAAERLAGDMRMLGSRLVRIADQLDRHGFGALLNDLGEIQSQGTIIDAKCGRLGALQRVLADGRAERARAVAP